MAEEKKKGGADKAPPPERPKQPDYSNHGEGKPASTTTFEFDISKPKKK